MVALIEHMFWAEGLLAGFCWVLTLLVWFLRSAKYMKVVCVSLCLLATSGAIMPYVPPFNDGLLLCVASSILLALVMVGASLREDVALRKKERRPVAIPQP